jgi:hypothetical protein
MSMGATQAASAYFKQSVKLREAFQAAYTELGLGDAPRSLSACIAGLDSSGLDAVQGKVTAIGDHIDSADGPFNGPLLDDATLIETLAAEQKMNTGTIASLLHPQGTTGDIETNTAVALAAITPSSLSAFRTLLTGSTYAGDEVTDPIDDLLDYVVANFTPPT